MHNIPSGIDAKGHRIETGSIGTTPADRYLGARSERDPDDFFIGDDAMAAAPCRTHGGYDFDRVLAHGARVAGR